MPKKAGDTKSFAGVGSDPNATVQVEALAPDQLAGLVTMQSSDTGTPTRRRCLRPAKRRRTNVCGTGWSVVCGGVRDAGGRFDRPCIRLRAMGTGAQETRWGTA